MPTHAGRWPDRADADADRNRSLPDCAPPETHRERSRAAGFLAGRSAPETARRTSEIRPAVRLRRAPRHPASLIFAMAAEGIQTAQPAPRGPQRITRQSPIEMLRRKTQRQGREPPAGPEAGHAQSDWSANASESAPPRSRKTSKARAAGRS